MTVCLNGQTILEEEFDVNHIFTEMDVQDYAKWLEVDLMNEPGLSPTVIEGIRAPLPAEWKPCEDENGEIYYFNFSTGQSVWDHPCDIYCKDKIKNQRKFNLICMSKKQNIKDLYIHDLSNLSAKNSISQPRKTFKHQSYFSDSMEKFLPTNSEGLSAIKLLRLIENPCRISENNNLECKARFNRYDDNSQNLLPDNGYINNARLKIDQNIFANGNEASAKQKSIKKCLDHNSIMNPSNLNCSGEIFNSLNFKSEMNQHLTNDSLTEASNFKNYSLTKLSNTSSYLEFNSPINKNLRLPSIQSSLFEEKNGYYKWFSSLNENQVKNQPKICGEKNLTSKNSTLRQYRYNCYDLLKINLNILLLMTKLRKLNTAEYSQNRCDNLKNITIKRKQIHLREDIFPENSINSISIDSLSFKNNIHVPQIDTLKTIIHSLLPDNFVKQIMQNKKYKEKENKSENWYEFQQRKLNEFGSFAFKREQESNTFSIKSSLLGSEILPENIPYQREWKTFEQRTKSLWTIYFKDRMNCFDVNFENNKPSSTILPINSQHCINWDEMSRKLAEMRSQRGCINKNVVSKSSFRSSIREKIKTFSNWLKEAQMFINTQHNQQY